MSRMFHPDGEQGVASAAADAGCGYALSTMATASIEDIGAISAGPKVYQLYLLADDALNFASIDRCKDAGFDALCLTVDRSEERRVGQECGRTCRSRWSSDL